MLNWFAFLAFQLCFSWNVSAQDVRTGDAQFSARISKINATAQLIRFRTDFPNLKYLTRGDEIKFWIPSFPNNKCSGKIEGKTAEYLLVYVQNYNLCSTKIYYSVGSYVQAISQDLIDNLKTGRALTEILLKKRMAVQAKKDRVQKELDSHIEKVETVNKRYEILRQKLELEWKKELEDVDEDKVTLLQNFKELESQVQDIDFKLEQYKVADENMEVDRWALDPRLYFKK